ncbi:MAG TPA: HD domain-containing protein [Bacteroidia bacterium]|nr:HD domain-containing protein [Bacteroidia bacterium]HNT79149.1 HD domain-containing protein [Bacteroidia bacterium]
MKEFVSDPEFEIISDVCDELNTACYVIGGYVRDKIMNRSCTDIDIVVDGDGIAIASKVAERTKGSSKIVVFKKFGTAMFEYNEKKFEFVGARKESYRLSSRKPEVSPGTLEDDQKRRDFTINALAIALNKNEFGKILDPFGGMDDIESKTIKTPLDPEITYIDDPLRMMRAIRFATQLEFTIEEESLKAIALCKERISIVSQERITEEINKIILSRQPSIGFKLLFDTGLLQIIFPEMAALQGVETIQNKSHKDNFYHTLQVLDNISILSNDLWLRWAAILHDIAKPLTKRFDTKAGWTFHGHEDKGARMVPYLFKKLKLPLNEKMKFVQKLVLLHLRPIVLAQSNVTDSAVRRLLFEAGHDVDALMLLCQADITSKNEWKVKKYLNNFELVKQKLIDVEEQDHLRNWQPPVDGNEIMQLFKLKPGKEIGQLKNALREAIIEGEIKNDRQEALEFLNQYATQIGIAID